MVWEDGAGDRASYPISLRSLGAGEAALGSMKMTRDPATVKGLYDALLHSRRRKFPMLRAPLDAPRGKGVYVIYSPKGKVVHVGRTPKARGGLAQRLKDHMSGASSFTLRYLKKRGAKLRGRYSFRCLVVRSARLRAYLEAYATGCLCPAHIGLSQDAS